MKSMQNKTRLILLAGSALMMACQHSDVELQKDRELLKAEPVATPVRGDGIVLAEGHLVGTTLASGVDLSVSDCEGQKGYGVRVGTKTEDKKYLFNRDGEPCRRAETLFDGGLKVFRRAADPSVNITFVDKYGKLPEKDVYLNTDILDITNINTVPRDMPEDAAMAPYKGTERQTIEYAEGIVPAEKMHVSRTFEPVQLMPPGTKVAGRASDTELSHSINSWKQDNAHREIVEEAEHLLAGVRNLSRKSSDELLKEHQDQIKALLTQLRGSEKVIEYQQEKERRLRQEIEKGQRTLISERRDRQQTERKVSHTIAQKEQRAKEYEMIANDLKRKHMDTVRSQEEQMLTLRQDLAYAEKGASRSRQSMILEAAKKIAEAEAIAQAANIDKRSAMEREANRLHIDASTVLRRAMAIDSGESIVIPAFDNLKKFEVPEDQYKQKIMALENRLAALETPVATKAEAEGTSLIPSHPMEETMVVIKEVDQTLEAVMNNTLAKLSDRIGDWRVEWRLSKEFAAIPQDKWTVIAEARFDEFLAYVQGKVKQTHGTTLTFRRFDNARLFVISN